MADVITQAAQISERLGFVQRRFWEIRHLGWSACGYPTLEVRIGIRAADETDITSLACDLTFVVSADITWKPSLSSQKSRLFLVGDTLWTAREFIEQRSCNDVPGLGDPALDRAQGTGTGDRSTTIPRPPPVIQQREISH